MKMFAAIKDWHEDFKYGKDVRVAYCMYLKALPMDAMALLRQLDSRAAISEAVKANHRNNLAPEETALLIACRALELLFNQTQDKAALKASVTQVWSTDSTDFQWSADAYSRAKASTLTMPDGMVVMTLVVGFAFWMARKMQRDGKIKPEAARSRSTTSRS
jgi:hypothetical protein